jgi:hypothetical protein
MNTIATTESAGKHRVFHHADKVAAAIIWETRARWHGLSAHLTSKQEFLTTHGCALAEGSHTFPHSAAASNRLFQGAKGVPFQGA